MGNLTKLSFLVIATLVTAAPANVYKCKSRTVEVKFAGENKGLPCEVKYTKEGESEGKTLWTANNDAAYCEQKAKEFADKLTSQGYACTGGEAAAEKPTDAKAEGEKK